MSAIVTHYLAPTGHFIHALPAAFGACNASRQVAKVDCEFCLSILGTNATHAPTERTEALTEAERATLSEAIWLWDETPEQTVEDHVLPVIERILASRLAVRDGEAKRWERWAMAAATDFDNMSDRLNVLWMHYRDLGAAHVIAGDVSDDIRAAMEGRPTRDASGDAGEGGGS